MLTTAEPLKFLLEQMSPAASAKVALIAATWPDNVTEFVPLPDAEVTPLVTSNLTVNVPLVTLNTTSCSEVLSTSATDRPVTATEVSSFVDFVSALLATVITGTSLTAVTSKVSVFAAASTR